MSLQDLHLHGFRFKKKYGQNFITDPHLLKRIAGTPSRTDYALEIGAGAGSLTRALSKRFNTVCAFEIDTELKPILTRNLTGCSNVQISWQDAMKIDLNNVMMEQGATDGFAVVANLPYYITTPLIMKLLEEVPSASELVLMMQAEVAERMVAKPGSKTYGAISVAIAYHCNARIAFTVNKQSFTPKPKVDSAVLHLKRYTTPPVQAKNECVFREVLKAAFGQRRKTLRNALKSTSYTTDIIDWAGSETGIDLNRRGETLALAEFIALADAFTKGASS